MKTDKNPLNTNSFNCLFSTSSFLHSKIFTDNYYPSGYMRLALWADSVSLQMDTITSHDNFKPITIGENLVVNYNG